MDKPQYARIDYSYRMPSTEELEAAMTPELKAVRDELARRLDEYWERQWMNALTGRPPAPTTYPVVPLPRRRSPIFNINLDVV